MSSLLFPGHLLCRPWSYVVRCISTHLWGSLHGADPWRPPEAFLDLLCGPWTLPGTLTSQRLPTALGWLEFLSVSVFLPCALTRFPPWTQAQTPTLPVSKFIWSFQRKFGRKEVRQTVFVVILNTEVLFLPTAAFPGMNVLSLLSLTSFLSPRLPRWMTSICTRLHGRKFSSTASPHARAQKLCGAGRLVLIPIIEGRGTQHEVEPRVCPWRAHHGWSFGREAVPTSQLRSSLQSVHPLPSVWGSPVPVASVYRHHSCFPWADRADERRGSLPQICSLSAAVDLFLIFIYLFGHAES